MGRDGVEGRVGGGVKRKKGASKERDEGKWEKQEGEKKAGGKRW